MNSDKISVGSIASSMAKNSTEFMKSQIKKLKKAIIKEKPKVKKFSTLSTISSVIGCICMIFDTIATLLFLFSKVGGEALAELTKNKGEGRYNPFLERTLFTVTGIVFLLDCGHLNGFNICRIIRGIIYLVYGIILFMIPIVNILYFLSGFLILFVD